MHVPASGVFQDMAFRSFRIDVSEWFLCRGFLHLQTLMIWRSNEESHVFVFVFFFSEHSNALLFCSLHHLDRHPCHPILMVRRLLGGVYNHRMWTTKKEQRGESREIFHNWTLFPAMKHFPKKSLNRSLKVKHVSLVDSSVGKPKERGPWFTVELDDGIPLYYNYPVWLPKFLFDLQFFRLSSSSFLQTCIFNKLSIKKNQKPFEN